MEHEAKRHQEEKKDESEKKEESEQKDENVKKEESEKKAESEDEKDSHVSCSICASDNNWEEGQEEVSSDDGLPGFGREDSRYRSHM